MNDTLSRHAAEEFLNGAFNVLESMLSSPFSRSAESLAPLDESSLGMHLVQMPVMLRARVRSGGAVAMFLSVRSAAWFAARVLGSQPVDKTALDADDIATLREMAAPCLGGGVTSLMEQAGRDIEQPEQIDVESLSPGAAAETIALFSGEAVGVPFRFSAEGIDGSGLLAFSSDLEKLGLGSRNASGPGVKVSSEEVQDILSGLEDAPDTSGPPPARESPSREILPNMDMVLDIRMVATARLGRIEMPIAEILSLGPGSIVHVGRLVDEPVELLVNDKLIARGDVVVVDERFGLRITEIVSAKERIESMH